MRRAQTQLTEVLDTLTEDDRKVPECLRTTTSPGADLIMAGNQTDTEVSGVFLVHQDGFTGGPSFLAPPARVDGSVFRAFQDIEVGGRYAPRHPRHGTLYRSPCLLVIHVSLFELSSI